MRRTILLGASLLAVIFVADATKAPQAVAAQSGSPFACGEKLAPYVQTSLFLDRSGPQRISDKRWKRFTAEVLVREFPAGGTVLENTGWWKAPDGRMDAGEGFTVIVTSPLGEAAAHRAAAERVVEEMKRQFQQQSVLREEETVCAVF